MASFDGLAHRELGPADAARAVLLSAEAGWNQTEADWRLMLTLGHGWGLWSDANRLAATALILPYGNRFAWISMVLVSGDFRRRGIATKMLEGCIETLRTKALAPVLDATEAGRKVYRPLGFEDIYPIQRMTCRLEASSEDSSSDTSGPSSVRAMQPGDLEAIRDVDAAVFGADRSPVLEHLYYRQPKRAFIAERDGRVSGYVLARDGRDAHHMGPLVAEHETTALALARRALTGLRSRVYVDVVSRHGALVRWLMSRGFETQRSYMRMILGRAEPFDNPERTFAIAGPELG